MALGAWSSQQASAGAARAPRSARTSRRTRSALVAAAALAALAALACASAGAFAGQWAPAVARGGRVERAAQDGGKEDDGGFLKFLKVEQDIKLTPEEYAIALDQEVEAQRRKYYINGEVKPNNLIVPWKPVDEKALAKEARRTLTKNGIKDPEGVEDPEMQDSELGLELIGEQDVVVNWAGGAPAEKVGYIIERKPKAATNYMEVASYEDVATSGLLAKEYAGHEFNYVDQLVQPGTWNYRVLCRSRNGEVKVVDEKEIVIVGSTGLDNSISFALLGVTLAVFAVLTTLADSAPTV